FFFSYIISSLSFFFFTHLSSTVIYSLSLHDALPIFFIFQLAVQKFRFSAEQLQISIQHLVLLLRLSLQCRLLVCVNRVLAGIFQDRKSTRLNSSHRTISYAVFCLKKKTYIIILYSIY